jgi:hypothetical protein
MYSVPPIQLVPLPCIIKAIRISISRLPRIHFEEIEQSPVQGSF